MTRNQEKNAKDALYESIFIQVTEALSNALGNGFPPENDRSPKEIVLEIHDWSGIEDFDYENPDHIQAGINAVVEWRTTEQ